MATPAVASAGYDTYRRIGYGYRESYTYQLRSFWQKGDYFNYDYFKSSDTTQLSGAALTTLTLRAIPKGVSVQARLSTYAFCANSGNGNVAYFSDGLGQQQTSYTGVAANQANTWSPTGVEAHLWTDTTARIVVTSVSTGASPTPTTPVTCGAMVVGYMDPRGKY